MKTTRSRRPYRVLWVAPGGTAERGGIGQVSRVGTQALAQLPEPPTVTVLDPRGLGGRWASLLRLPLALAQAVRWRLRGPAILHVHIAARGSTWRKLAFVLLGRLTRTPVVLHLHAGLYPAWYRGLPAPLRALVAALFRRADRVVALTEGWATFLVDELGVNRRRIEVLENGVFGPATLDRVESGRAHFLYLGKMTPNKGVGEIVEALGHPSLRSLDWRATLAGEGEELPALRQRAEALGIADRVSFPGWVEPGDVPGLLGAANVLVLPSHWEALPMSVLEAMSHGLAVACTPVGALPEILEQGASAEFVAIGDIKGLAAAMARLAGDSEYRARLGARARKTWVSRFNAADYGVKLRAMYDRLAASR